jgi:disulfide bond formation protein DsbB
MNNEATVEQFKADVAAMRVKEASVGRENAMRIVGCLLMVFGVVLGIYGVVLSLNAEVVKNGAENASGIAEQRDAIVQALLGVTLAIVGAALFLRYSFGQFLRYWMARMIFEQQRNP